MNVKELLKKCQRDRTAVLATNFYNFETLTAVMQAAQRMQAPVLLQLTRSSIDYMGLEQAVGMGRRAIADYGVEGWIHLDHGGSVELVERCLDAGFDSVMIDASERPFDENVSTTRRIVELARPYGVNVEAELGYVAKLGQAQGGGFTTPEEAARFVEATGVDALAVAIGSAHGFYKQTPRLDIERLAQIHAATDAALVLHGSSGIPHDMVREAIANGIVSGTSATTFSPDASITRQDMAVMLYQYTQRYDVALQQQTVTPFTDESSISAYALPAVQALHRAGVISGMPDGSFQPFGTATREQACVVLCAL